MATDYASKPNVGSTDVWNKDTTTERDRRGESAFSNRNLRDTGDRSTDDRSDDDRHKYRRVLSAGTLTGDRVRNSAGEDLGKIEEIMIDVQTGRVAYAVLSFGGFLGIGDKLFAVPWQAMTLNEADHEFVLNVDKAALENAPGFDKDNWPDMADPDWGSRVFSHYGYKPYWESDSGSREHDFRETESNRELAREKTYKGGGGL